MEEKMVDGIIISVTQDTRATEYFKTLREKNLPIVFFNRIAPEVSAYNVIIDDYKWAFTAVEHLIKEGYKRIAHLAGPENLFLSKERKRGYIDALKIWLPDRRRVDNSCRNTYGKRYYCSIFHIRNAEQTGCHFCR